LRDRASDPDGTLPSVPDETERVDLIAYLRALSDKPMPLP